jgi:potassium-transporting ATPase KdpC subunit
MSTQIKPALILFALLTLVTGVVFPLAVTGLAQVLFPDKANGSLIEKDGHVFGSALIGQGFSDPRYFWPRPSATAGHAYNAFDAAALTGSSGSNLGPLSQSLVDSIRQRVEVLHIADPTQNDPIPVDLVTASASGLDPHISPAAAYYQVGRVARARGLNEQEVRTLVDRSIEGRQLGILGEPRVNVFLLNLALDGVN